MATNKSPRETAAAPAPAQGATWIVVAAYNEQERIGPVLDDLLQTFPNVVVVDDGSVDGTAGEALQRPVWLLEHGVNLGQGAALQTGIAFALSRNADYIVTFDADGQHSSTDIPALLQALAHSSADYALGSRFLGTALGITWSRKAILRMAVIFNRVLYRLDLTDAHNGLRAMTKRGAEQIRLTMNRMEHASEIVDQIARSRLKCIEVPVHISYSADSLRKGQKSSGAIRIALNLLLEKILK